MYKKWKSNRWGIVCIIHVKGMYMYYEYLNYDWCQNKNEMIIKTKEKSVSG